MGEVAKVSVVACSCRESWSCFCGGRLQGGGDYDPLLVETRWCRNRGSRESGSSFCQDLFSERSLLEEYRGNSSVPWDDGGTTAFMNDAVHWIG